jgi:hypothetical protein
VFANSLVALDMPHGPQSAEDQDRLLEHMEGAIMTASEGPPEA